MTAQISGKRADLLSTLLFSAVKSVVHLTRHNQDTLAKKRGAATALREQKNTK